MYSYVFVYPCDCRVDGYDLANWHGRLFAENSEARQPVGHGKEAEAFAWVACSTKPKTRPVGMVLEASKLPLPVLKPAGLAYGRRPHPQHAEP